jgi:hypothetical protein
VDQNSVVHVKGQGFQIITRELHFAGPAYGVPPVMDAYGMNMNMGMNMNLGPPVCLYALTC